ncbi:MAG: hypothetical protein J5842_07780, partial [Lachnospiraceae bacterium]|nr:hypothetical protein [Lachnospiraceae bacterium]
GFVIEGCDVSGSYITCGKLKDTTALQRENVCLIYATDQTGSQDYYLYDLLGGGYVHYLNASSKAMSSSFSKRAIAIMVILGVSLFVCLIIILVLSLKKGETYFDYDNDPYDDDKDTFADDDFKEKPKKKKPVREVYAEPEEDRVRSPRRDDDEPHTVRKVQKTVKKPAAEPVDDMGDVRDEKNSMPEPTVKRVKKKRPATSLPDDSSSFDIDKEIRNMTENAKRQSQTARMADIDAALKTRSTTRTVMPEKAGEMQRPRKAVRKEEITIDNPPKRPTQSRPKSQASQDEASPKVTRTVTEKGVTYTTGKIPITVVQPQSRKNDSGSVPIFTLDKEDVRPPRESLPGEPDTDFEFGYIDADK